MNNNLEAIQNADRFAFTPGGSAAHVDALVNRSNTVFLIQDGAEEPRALIQRAGLKQTAAICLMMVGKP